MSQTQCLPLSRKRGAWCQDEEEESPTEDNTTTLQQDVSIAIQTGSSIEELQTMSAMEYLSMVHREANSLPRVFVSNKSVMDQSATPVKKNSKSDSFLPIDGSAAMATYLSSRADVMPAQHAYQLPVECTSWVTHALADFSSLRKYLEQQQAVSNPKIRVIPFPKLKDSGDWHEFCLGAQEAEGNIDGYFDDNEEGEEDDDEEEPEWKSFMRKQSPNKDKINTNGIQPSVSLLIQMDQVMTRRVLMHLTSWVVEDDFPMSHHRALWLYALLARLEKPLHRNESALLRSILRTCCKLRAVEKTCSNTLPLLNVLIAIVGVYFEQGPQVMSLVTC